MWLGVYRGEFFLGELWLGVYREGGRDAGCLRQGESPVTNMRHVHARACAMRLWGPGIRVSGFGSTGEGGVLPT